MDWVWTDCGLTNPADIVVVIDQRCESTQPVFASCDDRRSLVYDIFNTVFTEGLTQMALVTLECVNPMGHIDFTSTLNQNKTAMLNYLNDETQFEICLAHPFINCVNSCGVGLDTALNCFENNGSPNNRKILLFISFCECEGQGTDSICNRQTYLEEQGIEVIVANIDVSSDNAICVDSDENTISTQNGISQTIKNQIYEGICTEPTPTPTQQTSQTSQTTTDAPTSSTTTTATPTGNPTTTTTGPVYGLLFFLFGFVFFFSSFVCFFLFCFWIVVFENTRF